MRLQADGLLDLVFGNNGSTTLDLESDSEAWPRVNDMQVLADGAIVAAGGYNWQRPFVARLLGNSSGGGPGVADFGVTDHEVSEADGSVSVSVRRIGGRTGAVSVQYEAMSDTATAGADFGQVTGQLTWGDGDMGARNLSIPLNSDRRKEGDETITLSLSNPTGGVLLGAPSSASVRIVDDDQSGGGGGHAGGLFALLSGLAGLLRLRRRATG